MSVIGRGSDGGSIGSKKKKKMQQIYSDGFSASADVFVKRISDSTSGLKLASWC